MNRPYDVNDCVEMVGHDDRFIQFDLRVSRREGIPHVPHKFAAWIQYHCPAGNLSKHGFTAMGDNGDEI